MREGALLFAASFCKSSTVRRSPSSSARDIASEMLADMLRQLRQRERIEPEILDEPGRGRDVRRVVGDLRDCVREPLLDLGARR